MRGCSAAVRPDRSRGIDCRRSPRRHTVTELGAGIGRYAKAIRASGLTGRVVAYDGMPDVASKSGGAVRYPNLSTTHTSYSTVYRDAALPHITCVLYRPC